MSWPGFENQVRGGLQSYIAQQVCLGDPLELQGREMRHKGETIGRLSGDTSTALQQANANPQLRVSNVIRYTCGNYYQKHNPAFWRQLDDSVRRQGWFYLVLAEEAWPTTA